MKARNWWLLGLVALVVAAGAAFALIKTGSQGKRAELASGYVAHVVCSCRYLGNRDMASCATDFEPGMELVRMEDDTAARRITAWVPLIAKRTAVYQEGYGCLLEE